MTVITLSAGLATQVIAGETRFEIDPRADLTALGQSGEIQVTVSRQGAFYHSDASAVLTVDIDRLSAASLDYGNYVQMRMPNLRESVIVKSEANRRWIWTYMEGIGSTSQHYLEARIHESLSDSAGSRGIDWMLYRIGPRSGPEFNRVDQPAFNRLDGSWYMRPLGNGKVYVRYFLMADLAIPLPDVLMSGVVTRRFKEGVRQVVRVLARTASVRQ